MRWWETGRMTTSIPRRHRGPDPAHDGPSRTHAPDSEQHRPAPAAVVAVRRIFAHETGNFFLILGTTLFLVVFGLVMVLSSSSVTSYTETDDFFSGFSRQATFAAIGVPIMLLCSRMPAVFWKKWAGLAMVAGIGLQLLVIATPLGIRRGGNTNWLDLGVFTLQPSEVTKVALAIWLAYILSTKADKLHNLKQLALPIAPVAGASVAFVLVGGDLGTAVILMFIIFGSLFFAGVRLRFIVLPLLAIAVAVPALALSSNSRGDRVQAWLDQCSAQSDLASTCWQTVHGWWALAAGGVFGVGLGNSKAKWSWLPAADNDFIFAIIGEELGLLGAITVLVLFIVLAIGFVRVIRANRDPFARITVSAIMVWIIGQAFVNIAVVLGVLPVLGVPLPFISAGGSALIMVLVAVGIVLSFARHPVPARGASRA